MVVSDDSGQDISGTEEEQDADKASATPGQEDNIDARQNKDQVRIIQKAEDLVARPASLQRPARSRRLLSIMSIFLFFLLIFAIVRLSMALTPSDDQLEIQVGDQASATVDLRQSIPISPYLFGANAFPAINTSSVDQEHSGFMSYSPPVVNGLQNAHIKLLRFPGGKWGEEHLLSYDQLNTFSTLLSEVGAEGMVQARLSGTSGHSGQYVASLENRINQAGNWVDYMNNPHSSFRTGKYAHAPFHPIKFWAVGNEPDRLINPDTGKLFTVAEYVNDFILFSTTMHQNNPTIQVFGPELSQFSGLGAGPTDANGAQWMEDFLKGVGTYEKSHPDLKFHLLDGVSFHFYPFADAARAPSALLSSASEWSYLLPPLRQLIRQDLGRDVPVAVTEINVNPTQQVYTRGISALWWADTLGTLMSQQVENAAFFASEGIDTPYPLFTSDGLHQTPMLRVMQLFSHLQHNLVPLATQRDPTSIYATQDDAHQTVSLLFVNKSALPQLAQISGQNYFLSISAWHQQDISLNPYSVTVVTLHNGGGAEAYSYTVPASDNTNIVPLTYTICGHKTDTLSNTVPC